MSNVSAINHNGQNYGTQKESNIAKHAAIGAGMSLAIDTVCLGANAKEYADSKNVSFKEGVKATWEAFKKLGHVELKDGELQAQKIFGFTGKKVVAASALICAAGNVLLNKILSND